MIKQILKNQKILGKTQQQQRSRREGKGRVLALSRNVFRLQNKSSHIYDVESESRDDHYYFAKFKPDVFEWYCSCKDNSTRHLKCKHFFAIEFAMKWGTIKDIDDKLSPTTTATAEDVNVKERGREDTTVQVVPPSSSISKTLSSYKDDDYTF